MQEAVAHRGAMARWVIWGIEHLGGNACFHPSSSA